MSVLSRRHALTCLGALALSAPFGAASAQTMVSGVAFPDTVSLDGETLQLNGAGIRYRAVFPIYAAGLYLTQKATDSEAVHQLPGRKFLRVRMLRDIKASDLANLFSRGIMDNNDKVLAQKLLPSIGRMGDVFSRYRALQIGDEFAAELHPDKGMVLLVKGQPQEQLFEEAFFPALLNIWLGPHPADAQLKKALLGTSMPEPSASNTGGG